MLRIVNTASPGRCLVYSYIQDRSGLYTQEYRKRSSAHRRCYGATIASPYSAQSNFWLCLQCVVLAAPGFYLLPAFGSFCDVPTMLSNSSDYHAVFAVTNGVSVLVCLLAAILVLRLKLCKILVYRLALYQVLSALVMASVETMQVVFINYEQSPKIYGRICIISP